MAIFVSTEGNCGPPIILGKDPVEKPCLLRGLMSIGLDYIRDEHHDGTVTFTVPVSGGRDRDALATYHRAPLTALHSGGNGMVGVMVDPTTLITWDWKKPTRPQI